MTFTLLVFHYMDGYWYFGIAMFEGVWKQAAFLYIERVSGVWKWDFLWLCPLVNWVRDRMEESK